MKVKSGLEIGGASDVQVGKSVARDWIGEGFELS